jgi:hypothetical protein
MQASGQWPEVLCATQSQLVNLGHRLAKDQIKMTIVQSIKSLKLDRTHAYSVGMVKLAHLKIWIQ